MVHKNYSTREPLCRVTFTLPREAAKGARDVRLVGEFNGWEWEDGYKMIARDKEFAIDVELAAGREYQFRFLIDNRVWENHWSADRYAPTPFGVDNSVVSLHDGPRAAAAAARPRGIASSQKKADDLTKIEGIGPKIAELLNAAGIVSFADLAAAKLSTLTGILQAAGRRYQMHDPSTWAEQSRLAATGEWSKLTELQRRLDGGSKA